MMTVQAPAPPPRQGPATPPRSAPVGGERPVGAALPGSVSAVLAPPPPVGPRSPTTSPTSGTRDTPVPSHQPVLEVAPSP